MSLIFLCAGGFSGAVTAAGGVESTVNLGLSVLPPSIAVVGLFVIGCFISVSMGTSMGTIAALAPIAAGISEKTEFSAAVCIGAVVCGAMFGDNLSVISDTTIAAVKTQGCEMKDKFKANFLIVLPAAILTIVIFWLMTRNGSYQIQEEMPYSIWKVLPYLVVLVGALAGINVFVVLIRGKRGGEFGIAVLALFVDLCTANNTIAIVMAGPIAKEISEEYDIDPKRSASLLDIFTSVGQGMIPYGAQLLSAATLTGLTPFDIIPNLFYPILMGVSAILFIVFKKQN